MYGLASVEPVTRALNVEAFMVCSACRIRQASSTLRTAGDGSLLEEHVVEVGGVVEVVARLDGSSPLRRRWKAATMVGSWRSAGTAESQLLGGVGDVAGTGRTCPSRRRRPAGRPSGARSPAGT